MYCAIKACIYFVMLKVYNKQFISYMCLASFLQTWLMELHRITTHVTLYTPLCY